MRDHDADADHAAVQDGVRYEELLDGKGGDGRPEREEREGEDRMVGPSFQRGSFLRAMQGDGEKSRALLFISLYHSEGR